MKQKTRYKEKNVIKAGSDRHPISLVNCKYVYAPNRHKAKHRKPAFICQRCPKYRQALMFACNYCNNISCEDCDLEKKAVDPNIPQRNLDTMEHLCAKKTILFIAVYFTIMAFALYYAIKILS